MGFQVFWASNNLYYISIENGATKIVYADKNIGKLSSLKAWFNSIQKWCPKMTKSRLDFLLQIQKNFKKSFVLSKSFFDP